MRSAVSDDRRAPSDLIDASLDGNTRRAIDSREGDEIDDAAFKALVRAAMGRNRE